MISTRYVPVTAVLLGLALVPTVVHTYVGMTASDGLTSAVVPRTLDGIEGSDTGRATEWVRQYFATDDFFERRYGADVTLFVARGYDLKQMYHHPELGLAYGRRYDKVQLVHLPAATTAVPVHLLTGPGGLAAYVLLYDGKFIERPLEFHARQAFSLLFNPPRQMTLFFVHELTVPEPANSPAVRVLLAAIDSFHAEPSTSSR
jgi:hypothetical protein